MNKPIPFKNGKIEHDMDVELHIPAHGAGKTEILEYYPSSLPFDEMALVEQICEMAPRVEGQNHVSPLMRQAFAQAIRNVSNHSYRRGTAAGYEAGFWECCEALGDPFDSDDVEDWLEKSVRYAEESFYGGTDIEDGWFACGTILHKIPMDRMISYAQGHWMDLKDTVSWLERIRAILVRHQHISSKDTLYDPQGAMEELIDLCDMFRLEHSLGISCFLDGVDVLAACGILEEGYAEECKHLLSLETLELLRAGVPLEDIFA